MIYLIWTNGCYKIFSDCTNKIKSGQLLRVRINYFCTGCPKKNAILCLMGHRGHQEWTRDKSRVSFENLRKFPFWWAQKLPIFDRKWLRKMRSKMPTPMVKWHDFLSHWKCSVISIKRLVDNPVLAIKFLLN